MFDKVAPASAAILVGGSARNKAFRRILPFRMAEWRIYAFSCQTNLQAKGASQAAATGAILHFVASGHFCAWAGRSCAEMSGHNPLLDRGQRLIFNLIKKLV